MSVSMLRVVIAVVLIAHGIGHAFGIFWNSVPFFFPNKVGVIAVDVAAISSPRWLESPPGNLG